MTRWLFLLVIATGAWLQASEPWTTTNTVLEGAYVAVVAMDVSQARQLQAGRDRGCYEQDPLLGRYPRSSKILCAGVVSVMGQAAIAYALPHPWREVWQGATLSVEVAVVDKNFRLGWKLNF